MNRGEVPGYEFEVPRGPRHENGPRHAIGHDSGRRPPPRGPAPYYPAQSYLEQSRPAQRQPAQRQPAQRQPAQRQPAQSRRLGLFAAGSGVFAVMRKRNWLMGLAAPILVAIAVGVGVVVVTGGADGAGGSGGAPSALAAGFPPARLAGPSFTGATATSRVALSAIGAAATTEVVAGSVDGGPALWSSADGGTTWNRAALAGPASLTKTGSGQLAAVVHGTAGWLSVGSTLARGGGPLVAASPDGRDWTAASGIAPAATVAAAAAAGSAGYVIVGHGPAGGAGGTTATAWYSPGLSGWRAAAISPAGHDQAMSAVTATASGFVAVGASGVIPAAWLSADGRTWRQVALPGPAEAVRASLDYAVRSGGNVVAAGTEFSATGASSPFAEVSADGGQTWTEVQLPVPDIGGSGTIVTALTAAGGGFTAVGTYVTRAGPEVVVWTLPPGAQIADAAAWATVTPQGAGLAGPSAQNAITALTADGATLTGVGFTAPLTRSGTPGAQRPTLWQSPIRY